MSEVKFEKGSEEWNMFNEFWKLCQTYWDPEEDDRYWAELVDSVKKFYAKYKTSFAKKLALLLLEECEHKQKENKKIAEPERGK